MNKLKNKLQTYSPFSDDSPLRNIVTGVAAREDVNIHDIESIGQRLVEEVKGQSVFSYSFKRRRKVKTLASASALKVNGEGERTIDPALLFQRMLIMSQTGDISLEDVMGY